MLALLDIESTDCECNDIFSKTNENLFFIESSGRNHLRPRNAGAIESAILQNAGMGISIIVGMISQVWLIMQRVNYIQLIMTNISNFLNNSLFVINIRLYQHSIL